MDFKYRSNSHRIKLFIPVNAEKTKFIQFFIIFEKGRKKSTKGLYKLKFIMQKKIMTKDNMAE